MEKKQYQQPRMDIYRMMWKENLMQGSRMEVTSLKSPFNPEIKSGNVAARTKERGSIIWGDED